MHFDQNHLCEISVAYTPKHSIADRFVIHSSSSSFEYFINLWNLDTINLYEEFKVMFLDRKNGVIGHRTVGVGNSCSVIVDLKQMFAIALKVGANGLILCHNHPSAQMKPSRPDNHLTHRISKGAQILELKLFDHLIITEDKYYSYSDEGNLYLNP